MDTVDRSARPAGTVVDVGLGVVFAAGTAFTAFMLATSWGGASWAFDLAVSLVVGALALLRGRWRPWAAVAGVAVAGAATALSLAADLPQEPAPVPALAMAVLVGSAIRTLRAGPAAGIAAGGVAVVALTWLSGPTGVTTIATAALAGALVLGPALRLSGGGRP
ncbi:hypothetical protein ACFQU9_07775 [Actinomadura namibiensis]|uniref:Metal transporter n=1 Tax=Actinomadura namibiensis TaxID=182080 RepID=A0A7W3M0J9_ACTNM|nr:metal transporter [Actinomadura namibiensis]MBA8957638.1 hypothetical protein [Actinomadura namibiensis]